MKQSKLKVSKILIIFTALLLSEAYATIEIDENGTCYKQTRRGRRATDQGSQQCLNLKQQYQQEAPQEEQGWFDRARESVSESYNEYVHEPLVDAFDNTLQGETFTEGVKSGKVRDAIIDPVMGDGAGEAASSSVGRVMVGTAMGDSDEVRAGIVEGGLQVGLDEGRAEALGDAYQADVETLSRTMSATDEAVHGNFDNAAAEMGVAAERQGDALFHRKEVLFGREEEGALVDQDEAPMAQARSEGAPQEIQQSAALNPNLERQQVDLFNREQQPECYSDANGNQSVGCQYGIEDDPLLADQNGDPQTQEPAEQQQLANGNPARVPAGAPAKKAAQSPVDDDSIPSIQLFNMNDIANDLKNPFAPGSADFKKYPAQGKFARCQRELKDDWVELATNPDSIESFAKKWEGSWHDFMKGPVKKANNAITSIQDIARDANAEIKLYNTQLAQYKSTPQAAGSQMPATLQAQKEKAEAKIEQVKSGIKRALGLIAEVNEGAKAHIDSTIKPCTSALLSMTETKAKHAEPKEAVTTLDGKIVCTSSGFNTQDFPACQSLVTTYNTSFVGEQGMQVAQEIDYQESSMDSQDKHFNSRSGSGDGNGPSVTAGLEVQKDSISKKEDIATQRSAFHAGKLAAVLTVYNKFPSAEDLHEKCEAKSEDGAAKDAIGINAFQVDLWQRKFENHLGEMYDVSFDPVEYREQALSSLGEFADVATTRAGEALKSPTSFQDTVPKQMAASIELDCAVVYQGSGFQMIKNDQAKDAAKVVMMEAGVEMGKQGLLANMFGDQVKKIKNMINGIEGFDPTPPPGMGGEEEAMFEKCEADPDADGCDEFNGGKINRGFATQNGFSIGGGSNGVVIGNRGPGENPTGDNPNNDSDNPNPNDRSNAVDPVSGPASVANKSSGGIEGGGVAAAGVQAGQGAGGAGGGGGGLGGGGGGGGAALGGAGAGGGRRFSGRGKSRGLASRYKGGSGSLYGRGGKGGRSKKSSKDNPLAGLLGKKKAGAKTGKNLNFRGPASEINRTGGSIFEQISSRYANVSKSKRLLEYEVKK